MKRICVLILTMIMLCMPMTALAEEMPSSPEATTDFSNEPSPDPAATVTPDPSVAADPAPTPTPEPTQTAAPTTQPGETFSLPANVYNTGRSALKNVMVTVEGAGLFPASAVFLGDITPSGTGNGELSVFAGQLSMTEGYTEDYGKTSGRYTISYTDEAGEEHTVDIDFSLEIVKPVIETDEEETELTEEPAFQWWVTILVGLAIIAIIVALIVVAKFTRTSKMR